MSEQIILFVAGFVLGALIVGIIYWQFNVSKGPAKIQKNINDFLDDLKLNQGKVEEQFTNFTNAGTELNKSAQNMQNIFLKGGSERIGKIGEWQLKNILEKMGHNPDNFQWVFEGTKVLSYRHDLGRSPRFINLVNIGIIQKFVEKALKFQNVDLISLEAFDLIRIAEGVPRAGVDYSTENFPQEAALGNHISYKKGCYIGQEPHARMYHRGHPNWLSVWLKVPTKSPAKIGSPLFQGGKEIGEITSFGQSVKDEGFHRGIAMIRHEIAKENTLLALEPDQQPFIEHEPLPSNIL